MNETENNKISHNTQMRLVIEHLNEVKSGYLLVTDKQFIVAIITDGDIRRGLSRGLSAENDLMEFANKQFVYVSDDFSPSEVLSLFEDGYKFIPVLDNKRRLITVLTPNTFTIGKRLITKIRSKAPVRLSLAGGGTDLPYYFNKYNDGLVINTTINKYAHCTMTLRNDLKINIISSDLNIECSYSGLEALKDSSDRLGLIRAAILEFKPNFGFDLFLSCDFPIGSGLGGSSALVVSIVAAFNEISGLSYSKKRISEVAFKIERIDFRINGGWQDQLASSFGGLNVLSFENGGFTVLSTSVSDRFYNEFSNSIVMCNLADGHDSGMEHRGIKNNLDDYIEGLTKTAKIAQRFKSALQSEDLDKCMKLIKDGWIAKKDSITHFPSSLPIVEGICEEFNSYACKLMGAGSSGYLAIFTPPESRAALIKKLSDLDYEVEKVEFVREGVETWSI